MIGCKSSGGGVVGLIVGHVLEHLVLHNMVKYVWITYDFTMMFQSFLTCWLLQSHRWQCHVSRNIADHFADHCDLIDHSPPHVVMYPHYSMRPSLPWNVLHSLQQLSGMSDAVKACTSWWQINGFTTSLRLVYFTLLQGFWYIVAHLQGTPYTFLFGFPCKMCRSFPCFSLEIDLWFSLASIVQLSHWL